MIQFNLKYVLLMLLLVNGVVHFKQEWLRKPDGTTVSSNLQFLYTSRLRNHKHHKNIAVLTNQYGDLLKSWVPDHQNKRNIEVEHVEMVNQQFIYLLEQHSSITKQTISGSLLWSTKEKFHHDFHVDQEANVYALQKEQQIINYKDYQIEVIVDHLVKINDQGEQLSKTSLYPALSDFLDYTRIKPIYRTLSPEFPVWRKDRIKANDREDLMHINTIELIDCAVVAVCSGDQVFLLSVANANLVVIYDLRANQVLWSYGAGILQRPHRPTMIADNKILLFDNGSNKRDYSRVLIVDLITNEIRWEYVGPPKFFSPNTSGAQQLKNGNILVTVSGENRLFEVSPAGDIVKRYLNPLGGYRGYTVQIND